MDVLKMIVAGGVTIGMITAATLPGRNTIGVIKATGQAGSGFLGTAIRGR